MEPRIQYAKTEDGVNIAYYVIGEGEPLMYTPHSLGGHIQLEWAWPEWRAWYEAIASKRMLIRFDGRGTGLSDRDVSQVSHETAILDMEAVLDRLGIQAFHLLGNYTWAGPVVRYAAVHAAKVTSLTLWCPLAKPSDIAPGMWSLADIGKTDWQTYTEVVAQLLLEYSSRDQVKQASKFMRESIDSETYNACVGTFRSLDISGFLSQVAAPTLVLHRDEAVTTLKAARDVASGIPNARLAVFDGRALWPFIGDSEPVLRAIDEFLSECEDASRSAAPAGLTSGFATILFTDMASSTTLADRLGDAAAQEVRRTHNDIVRSALAANNGNEIKHTGDGIMASFSTASSALESAIAIQRGVAAHKEEQPGSPLAVYVGLNAGEPIAEDDGDGRVDLFGTSINLAARICDHAEAGQIVASNVVRELTAGKDFLFSDLGETELRGFEDPVKLWELRWQED